ncbi:MAG: HisA/HisF-related TIM barrel protein [Candidatus Thorarchaeota archaeon]
MMEVYPAIDLMQGKVVRLHQGNPSEKTSYKRFGSPVEVAEMWESQGAQMLHIIDLDAALGRGSNLFTIKEIAEKVSIPIQVGGGFRNEVRISVGFYCGIERIILGSLAIQNPEYVIKIGQEYGFNRIVVSLDYKHSQVATHGWQSFEDQKVEVLLNKFRNGGICHFLMTSVERDGSLQGPDSQLHMVSNDLSDIIVAGGLSTTTDIQVLAELGFGAAILGKSLYENRISLSEAIKIGRGVA